MSIPTRQPSTRLLPDTTTISQEGIMHIAGYSLAGLAQRYGTPLYVFDRATIINACQQYWQAFRQYYHASCLPMASNYNLVPRPAVILIDEQQVRLMERLETYADLLTRYA